MKLLLLLAILCAVVLSTVSAGSTIWPRPKTVQYYDQEYFINPSEFRFVAVGERSDILNNAIKRYTTLMFRNVNGPQAPVPHHIELGLAGSGQVKALNVNVTGSDVKVRMGMDETYQLDTTRAGVAVLTAKSVFGALRGLESFSQLMSPQYQLTAARVDDAPRFAYRGFMIDTARHFYPLNVIFQHIDAMAYNKYNTLHWHLLDDQSFPMQSKKFPILSEQGAFSQRHIYTYEDIQEVIRYANNRGILVMPEVESAGHMTRGYEALEPKILSDCYKDGKVVKTGPLDPTLDTTYDFMEAFIDEVHEYFHLDGPGTMLHLGGDEALLWCWASNPQIAAWMEANNIASTRDLQAMYFRKLFARLQPLMPDTTFVNWQEVYTDSPDKIPKNSIIHLWKAASENLMQNVTRDGFKVIFSGMYYLNFISYGQAEFVGYYQEPMEKYPDLEPSVLGLETCIWSEWVDATNFIARAWPRASIVAERMWSPKEVNDWYGDAQFRVHEIKCKMIRRGINAQPLENGSNMTTYDLTWCDDEWNPRYVPFA